MSAKYETCPVSFPQRVQIKSASMNSFRKQRTLAMMTGFSPVSVILLFGEGFWLHPLVSRGFILRHASNCNLGLRCLNRQIPHAD
jgi:hypothetical protein